MGTALEVGRLSIEADGREARGVDIGGRLAAGPALIGIATGRVATAAGAVGATGLGDAAGTGPDEPPLAGAVPAVGVPPGGLAADGPALGLSPASGVVPVLVPPEEPEPPLGGSLVVLPGVSVVGPGGLVVPVSAPVLVALGLSLPLVVVPPGLSVEPLLEVLPLLSLTPLPVLDPDVVLLVVVVLVLLVVVFVELVSLVVLLKLWVDVVLLVPASAVVSAPAAASAVAVASAVPVPVATVVASVAVVLSAVVVVSVVVSVAAAVAALNAQHAIARPAMRRHRLVNPALRAAAVPALGKTATSGLAEGTDSDDRPRVVDGRWHDNRSSRQLTHHSPVHVYRLTR